MKKASTPTAHTASATHGNSAGSRQARARTSAPTATAAARIHGKAPKPAAARNSSAESGTSSSGNWRMRATFSTWLSTTVYQRKAGSVTAATAYQPRPMTTMSATPSGGSHARTGRSRPASAAAIAMAPSGPSSPSGSFASAATPSAAQPSQTGQSPRIASERVSAAGGVRGPFLGPRI